MGEAVVGHAPESRGRRRPPPDGPVPRVVVATPTMRAPPGARWWTSAVDFFTLSTPALVALLVLIIGGAIAIGVLTGRAVRRRSEQPNREPVGVVQGTLLGLVGLLLAFGLSMAVGRYEQRRSLVVQEANDIGTTYLRAQLLAEPQRSASLQLLEAYVDDAVDLALAVPGTGPYDAAAAAKETLHGELWSLAAEAIAADPVGSVPRLYVESLNPMIDTHTSRTASLGNGVPSSVMVLLVFGSAVALGVLSLYLALLGKDIATSILTGVVVLIILFVSFDLDRPERGVIRVPATPLEDLQASMQAD